MYSLRELTRLQAISQTPVVQIFTETLKGVTSIRIFRKEDAMIRKYWEAIDENYKNQLMLTAVRSWFGIRVEFLSLLIIIPGFFFCLYFGQEQGMFAIMLRYTLSITEDIGSLM